MKNIIKRYFTLVLLCVAWVHCTQFDDYKKYFEDGEIIYPQKAESVKTYPGKNRILLEWVIVDPKVTSCKVKYIQSGEKDSLLVPIDTHGGAEDDTTRFIIDNLSETTYSFYITSYDDYGNASITVETEESAYGEMYENALGNRVLKSELLDAEGLKLEWYSGEESEVGVELNYTDKDGRSQVYYVPNHSTTTEINDFSMVYPYQFKYRTLYKPDSLAIDTFYTTFLTEDKIKFQVKLPNAVSPFAITSEGWWVYGRFGTPAGWIVNAAAAQNGNVDNTLGNSLTMWAWSGYSPAGAIINGKIYQIVQLDAGSYTLRATIEDITDGTIQSYVAVATGQELPDIDNVEGDALAFLAIPKVARNTVFEIPFSLNASGAVSFGFIANIYHAKQIVFNKFELIRN